MEERAREVFDLLEPGVASQGLDLLEVTISSGRRRAIVRLVVHAESGVTHADCARVSRVAGRLLDERLPASYVLEVHSPGTDRVLRSAREFDLFRGRKIAVRVGEQSEEIVGRAAGTRGEQEVVLTTDDGAERVLDWPRVTRARLIPEPPSRTEARG